MNCFIAFLFNAESMFWVMVIRCPNFNIIKHSNSKTWKEALKCELLQVISGGNTWDKGYWARHLGLWRELLSSDTGIRRVPNVDQVFRHWGQHIRLPLKCLGRFILTPNMKILPFTSSLKVTPTTESVKRNSCGIEDVVTVIKTRNDSAVKKSDMCPHSSPLTRPL